MRLIRLSDAGEAGAAAGSKAARLGELLNLGFPVPDGLVLTEISRDRRRDDPRAASELAALHRAAEELSEGFAVPLICRSSAGVEDAETRSYAGLFATRPNIRSFPALLAAIEMVRRSAEGDGRTVYGEASGSEPAPAGMAVLIQRMIRPVRAGVVFTSAGPDHICVEAVFGHGEALVQGLASPYRFFVPRQGEVGPATVRAAGEAKGLVITYPSPRETGDWRPGTRYDLFPGGPSLRVIYVDGESGGVHSVVERDPRAGETPAFLGELRDLARRAEDLLGRPADLEWAVDAEGRVHLVQLRPITAPLPEAALPRATSPGGPAGASPASLTGVVASPGRAEGRAWPRPEGAACPRLEGLACPRSEGAAGGGRRILVAASVSPADLVAARSVSGVVVEEMGLLSHTAILCRELRIPCLVRVYGAAAAFPRGTPLEMEAQGDLGWVRVVRAVRAGQVVRAVRAARTVRAVRPGHGEHPLPPVRGPMDPPLADLGHGLPVPLATVIAGLLRRHAGAGVPSPHDFVTEIRRAYPAGKVLLWTSSTGPHRPPHASHRILALGLLKAELDAWVDRWLHPDHLPVVMDEVLDLDPALSLAVVLEPCRETAAFIEAGLPRLPPLVHADRVILVTHGDDSHTLSAVYRLAPAGVAGRWRAYSIGRG